MSRSGESPYPNGKRLDEIESLKVSLVGVEGKLAQIDRRAGRGPVDLGIPTVSMPRHLASS